MSYWLRRKGTTTCASGIDLIVCALLFAAVLAGFSLLQLFT